MSLKLVLVTDTNIWIDLVNGGLLPETFRLPYLFITPDFAKTEYVNPPWKDLEQLGLSFFEMRSKLIHELVDLRPHHNDLSVIDLSAFLLARDLEAILITGDRRLRKLAIRNEMPVHGVLWILDELIRTEIIERSLARERLERMIEMGARLPKEECQNRFKDWGTGQSRHRRPGK